MQNEPFIKLTPKLAGALVDLHGPGLTVFLGLCEQYQDYGKRGLVFLSYSVFLKEEVSRSTYARGMRELLDKRVIAQTEMPGWFSINPGFRLRKERPRNRSSIEAC